MVTILKLTCVMLMCMVMVAPFGEVAAVTCGSVVSNLSPCINYLRGYGGNNPSQGCCRGVRTLNNSAKTTQDRQTACGCLVRSARSISGIKLNYAAALPSKCGVNIPYKISPNTDCSKVR